MTTAHPRPTALRSRSFRSDRVAWGVFLVALLATVVATRAWLHRRVPLDRGEPVAARLDFRLPVLAYDRVAARPGEGALQADRVSEHLEALRAAGFRPISLRQVRDAYRGGAALPERPILLTFDGGHLSTYEAVDPILRRMRWPAAMFIDPRLQEERHSTYVYWDRLRRMVDSGLWDIGTVGRWPETARVIESRLAGYQVLGLARRAAEASPAVGSATPPLAFESGLFGVNDASADPLRLLRVRVRRGWSGAELVDRLTFSLSAPDAAESGAPLPVPPDRWVPTIGRLEAAGDVVTLSGSPRAEAWLAGGEWTRDFVLEAEVRPEAGPFWIVQQAFGSREQWRWGGTERAVYLERLRPGAPIDVVSRLEIPSRPGTWHSLRVIKRGSGVWVEWDGAPLPDTPRGVGARWRGQVGLSTGSPTEAGRVAVRNARFAAIPYRLRAVSASPPQREVQALLADAPRLAGISPPGLRQVGSTLVPRSANHRLLALIAARGGWDVVPAVELSDHVLLGDPARATELAELAARKGWAGVRLVADGFSASSEEAVRAAAPSWERAFLRRDLRFVLDVSGDRAPP
jgi:peptidoglycan/xylan/chitin deacetylase (PgdA/CDA1 family)